MHGVDLVRRDIDDRLMRQRMIQVLVGIELRLCVRYVKNREEPVAETFGSVSDVFVER